MFKRRHKFNRKIQNGKRHFERLGENCPLATPITEDSGMSLKEQSHTPGEHLAPLRPESSVETQPSAESQQTSSPTGGGGLGRGILLRQGSSSGSDSGSGSELSDENEPFLESPAGPKVPSERPPDLPSQEDLSVDQRAQVNPELISLNLSQLIL